MAAKVLNIEVGDQTISVCHSVRRGKAVRVSGAFVFPTPEGCVLDGAITNASLLAAELKRQFSAHGNGRIKNVVFSLSSSRIAVREVKLPPMKPKLIAVAVKTNAEEYFPIDLRDYHITYSVLETPTSAKPYSRVLVLAVPVAIIEGYFSFAEKAGLNIQAIDTSGNGQYQAFRRLGLKGVTVFADVGSAASTVSFIRDGKLLLQRSLGFGVEELLLHYMNLSGRTAADWAQLLNETDVTHPDFAVDSLLSPSDIQDDLGRLVGTILRTIDFFRSSQSETGVSRIVLTGLGRHVVGLRDLLLEATGLETQYLDELPEFARLTGGSPGASAFVGGIGSLFAPLALIPPRLLPKKRLTLHEQEGDESSIAAGVVICAVTVVGAVLVCGLSWLDYVHSANALAAAQAEKAQLLPARGVYESWLNFQAGEATLDAINALLETQNTELVAFFEALEKDMPASLIIESASCTKEGVSLSITVSSYTDAAAVIASLRDFESVWRIEISDLQSKPDALGAERVAFTVNCFYGVNPYTGGGNPYMDLVYPPETPAQ